MDKTNTPQKARVHKSVTDVSSETLATENIAAGSLPIDKMSPNAALALMLDNQAEAIATLRGALDQIEAAGMAAYRQLSDSDTGRLIYAGAGTSARIGVQDGVELFPTFNWPRERVGFVIAGGNDALLRAVENAEDDKISAAKDVEKSEIGKDDVVIGLAASGITPFTCEVLEQARTAGALTIGIANNADTRLLAVAEHAILLATGSEAIAGSTRLKAGTAQKICLNMMSNLIMVQMGFVKDGLMAKMVPTNAKLRARKKLIDAALDKASKNQTS
ncbi:N-acetylmuramic acid 6-phosphate etherase [Candidatus Puniceispirillum sp.]|jgi:N-acetylmuramic acid 6-phosphate etherase|uniref:N-acetylmuramic acid 6-phosphate etherase n=1 Tax=Candidatus Puniceispirillum sp. TaxID=2026719 RepID=UPI001EB12260|nr:N-acetylmuramic acid 6-phosphate etherase [Candidatus Puniceispirillum sp.]MBT6566202.1 N-acetylmuramic acid 6-phosphate etherase [Candidatus Puniceispirillum sp.]